MDAYRMIDKLVDSLDGLAMARGMLPRTGGVSDGIDRIFDLISASLDCGGVTIICPAEGDDFDPRMHQCARVDGNTGENDYVVSGVVSVGYYVDGRLKRPASVCVIPKHRF